MQLSKRFEGKWVLVPTVRMLKGMDTRKYWRENEYGIYDKCVDAYIDGTVMYATVHADSRQFDVVITQEGLHTMSSECSSCVSPMYRGSRWACAHAVMALQYLSENFVHLTLDSYTRKDRTPAMLERLSREEMVDFFSSIMASDHTVYARFIKRFGAAAAGVLPEPDYKLAIDRMYYMSTDPTGRITDDLDFGYYLKTARDSDAAKSVRICMALSESIRDNMSIVDDTDGYYTDCMIEAIATLAESVQDVTDRAPHIEHLAGQMTVAPKSIARHYAEALDVMCTDDADAKYLDSVLQSRADDSEAPGQTAAISHAQVSILEVRQGDHTERILQILSDAYRIDADLRAQYIAYLGRGNNAAAQKEIIRIAAEFPNDAATAEAALGVLDKSGKKYHKAALALYARTGSNAHYTLLKESGLWSASGTITALLKLKDVRKAISVCVMESMHDRAVEILESKKDLALFYACLETIGVVHSQRYFDAYAARILHLATARTARKKRDAGSSSALGGAQSADDKRGENVRRHLLRIKELGDKRYPELLNDVRSKNSMNTSLLAIIRDA